LEDEEAWEALALLQDRDLEEAFQEVAAEVAKAADQLR
jgi:hypothetical protein